MRFKVRFKLWQVLVGMITIACFGALMYFVTEHLASTVSSKEPEKDEEHNVAATILNFIFFLTFYYITLNIYYRLFNTGKKTWAFIQTLAITEVVCFVYHAFLFYELPQGLQKDYANLWSMFAVMFPNVLFMSIPSVLIAYIVHLRESHKQKKILEEQKLQLETQISQANFKFLKAQINPHFLHNTLNFLYAKSLPYSNELSEGILTLSDIMRYALSQGHQKDGKAALKDEIEHVRNVIKISQLRFSNQLKVNFEVFGDIKDAQIIPFVLITIVENAFKHGDLKSPEHPIDIRVDVRGNRLYFFCRNKKKTGPKELSTGIGIENIKKRLDLSYGDKYKFIVKDDPEFYSTELIIDEL